MSNKNKKHDLFKSLTEDQVADIDSLTTHVVARMAVASLSAACKGHPGMMLRAIRHWGDVCEHVEEIIDDAVQAIAELSHDPELELVPADDYLAAGIGAAVLTDNRWPFEK